MKIEPREKIQSTGSRRGFRTVHLNETVFPKLKMMFLNREVLTSPLPFRPIHVLHKKEHSTRVSWETW